MFTLHSGPFHPYLESQLVEAVQRIKSADVRVPLAIVVPSESLRRRLQWLLCVEQDCAFFNLHLLTFHQLVLKLDAERRTAGSSAISGFSLELVDELFFDHALAFLLQENQFMSSPLPLRAGSSGMRQALWRTIRDLQEAQVDPRIALQGVQEDLFDEVAKERLQGVFRLQERLQVWSRQLAVGLPDDLAHSVIPWISHSPFIAGLSEILYYGFYDVTQVQLTLLEEVARASDVSVFFPLGEDDAFQFARRFFDRHLLKAGVIHQSVVTEDGVSSEKSDECWTPHVQIINAAGVEGELAFTCKSIVEHVERRGYPWHDIGVVARTLEPYGANLSRIFKAHRIPLWTTATRPLLEEPLAKIWWILAGLRENQFPWRQMLDVLGSPWSPRISKTGWPLEECADVWMQAIRYFRFIGGDEDWERLALVSTDPAAVQAWHEHSGVQLEQASVSLQVLAEVIAELLADSRALPLSGSVRDLTDAYERLVKKYAWFPQEPLSSPLSLPCDERAGLQNGFEQAMASIRQLDRLDRHITWEQWTGVFRHVLENTKLPILDQAEMGVQVLDVMTARGRPFKVLYILGMNDHVFPRIVREDAFLRDRERKVLAESLGYKIDEKLKGFDEEQLLFALLHNSAKDDLYLLYQRADEEGRPLIPSSLLRKYVHQAEAQASELGVTFPNRLGERAGVLPLQSETAQESRLRGVLGGQTLQHMMREDPSWGAIFDQGINAIESLEKSTGRAGPFDGLIQDQHAYWQDLMNHGLSPTALATYAQCPMRYWLTYVVQVGGTQDLLSKELPSRVWGEFVHQVLHEVYQALSKVGWPQWAVDSEHVADLLNRQVKQTSDAYARKFGKGYDFVWDWMMARLVRMMMFMIEDEGQDYCEQGLSPCGYEVEAVGKLNEIGQGPLESLKMCGRFDRVDQTRDQMGIRIVDYKVSMRRTFKDDELDLVTRALQGRQLQPPLYSLMQPQSKKENSESGEEKLIPIQSVDFRYLRPLQEESVRTASFSSAVWNTASGVQLKRTIQSWVQGIRTGQFFLMPGAHCRTCQYVATCRVQHHPSWSRAYGLPLARTYRVFHKQKAVHV